MKTIETENEHVIPLTISVAELLSKTTPKSAEHS